MEWKQEEKARGREEIEERTGLDKVARSEKGSRRAPQTKRSEGGKPWAVERWGKLDEIYCARARSDRVDVRCVFTFG